jgi:uncharacterized membrane protein HdeD (DUF308 family)
MHFATNLFRSQFLQPIIKPISPFGRSSKSKGGYMSSVPAVTVVKKEYLGWSIVLSILLIVAGCLAIALPQVAGIAVNIMVGWLLIFSGAVHLVYSWQTRTAGGLIWGILLGLVYAIIGGYLLRNPILGLVSLPLGLAFYLFAEAVLELLMSYMLRALPGSGWLLFDGIITLILAVMIWKTWPSNTEWVLGTLVGISMLFSGISRLMISLAARRLVAQTA